MKITVHGNSGCTLEIVDFHGQQGIAKAASDASYVSRLKAQITKQSQAKQFIDLPFIHIPTIWDESKGVVDGVEKYCAVMEYLHYQNYCDFFLKASLTNLDRFVDNIISLVEFQLKSSKLELIDKSLFLNKLDEIENKIKGNFFLDEKLEQLNNLRNEINKEKVLLPVGICHGDLTLSNMMISLGGEKIGVFDFLDSYLESPLVDVAKLRQDTQFHWSRLMTTDSIDTARYEMVMKYIDKKIDAYFMRYEWYVTHYRLIQGMNIARIFPYEKDPRVSEFTVATLSKLGY